MGRAAIILGSNCESISDMIMVESVLPYSSIPGFHLAVQNVPGHSLEVLIGTLADKDVLCYCGRPHLYQGLSAYDVAAPVRHAYHAGCDTLINVCNAAALNGEVQEGDLMVVSDQLNFSDDSPLVGPSAFFPDDVPFIDMYGAYDEGLREVAHAVAVEKAIDLTEGAIACTVGPQYLTAVEARALHGAGCSASTLSLASEVIQARALGMRTMGIAQVTHNAGTRMQPANSIKKERDRVMRENMARLVAGIIQRL
jgi:purine-nucleoside phosphorylase